MKKTRLFSLIVCVYFATVLPHNGFAQTSDGPEKDHSPYAVNQDELIKKKFVPPVEIPPGMEMLNTGGVYVIVPKGLKIEKKGDIMVMEGPSEFAARSFQGVNERFEKIEAGQKGLQEAVNDLKREIASLKGDAPPPE
ncbi:MAG TPA: hypothetical protein P5561_01100 [Candidatus Omnitrophota bacterium]|jgi:hypothetical protein|nr:hypothetical protein [Candidatus Omnitrophota bacterium]HRY85110.1 hypothetical protein [Candidatus Omnitrophota bacterium]